MQKHISPIRYDEHPPEWEQYFSLVVGPVGFLDAFQAKLFEELALLGIGQAFKVRTHAGAVNPVEDRLGSVHYVLIFGLPDINAAGVFAKDVVIKSGRLHGKCAWYSGHGLRPARVAAERSLLDCGMGGRMKIVWHLHRQSSALRHAIDHAAKQGGM